MARTLRNAITSHAHLRACAGVAFLVFLVAGSLVQLAPQSFGLPAGQLALQAAVKGAVLQGIQIQVTAQDVKSLQGTLTGRRLDKVLKQFPCLALLLLCLPHLPSLGVRTPRWRCLSPFLLSTSDILRGTMVEGLDPWSCFV